MCILIVISWDDVSVREPVTTISCVLCVSIASVNMFTTLLDVSKVNIVRNAPPGGGWTMPVLVPSLTIV